MTKACQLFLVPSRSSNTPLYPSKCCELGSVLRLLLFCCFLLGLTFEPFKELVMRQLMLGKIIVNGFGLINVDLDPCPYHILTSIGGLEKA